jgi:hypothetical protein
VIGSKTAMSAISLPSPRQVRGGQADGRGGVPAHRLRQDMRGGQARKLA